MNLEQQNQFILNKINRLIKKDTGIFYNRKLLNEIKNSINENSRISKMSFLFMEESFTKEEKEKLKKAFSVLESKIIENSPANHSSLFIRI